MRHPIQPSALAAEYAGRPVLVTGHTGFKGSWLCLWLSRCGADVYACALPPDDGAGSLFVQAGVGRHVRSTMADIRDLSAMIDVFSTSRPEIVFHLAAQSLVQQGYDDPVGTFATNVMGTANVLEAARRCGSVKTVVCVTTDKVYLNREWAWPYRETDDSAASIPTARARLRQIRGEGIPEDVAAEGPRPRDRDSAGRKRSRRGRLVAEPPRAGHGAGAPLELRYPRATRPWRHVLDLCYAYLLLGSLLARGRTDGNAGYESA